ncbi:MAG: haloacid dehalogenase type II [Rhodospirillales bacterium]|nr:haloacid dehalogenase type II [Rhodospirillales bacterium]
MADRAVYVFDAYGTLFDVHSAVARLRERLGPEAERLSELWRIKQLEYSWVRSLMPHRDRRHRDFRLLTEDALDYAMAATGGIDPALRGPLLDAYDALDAYPEVPSVLAALKDKGARLAILSNGSPAMLADATRSAGLDHLFDAVLSVEDAGIFKPDPRVYQLACDRFCVAAEEVSFQSSNAWDAAGAAAFGFSVVWVNRRRQPREYHDVGAIREAKDLTALLEP